MARLCGYEAQHRARRKGYARYWESPTAGHVPLTWALTIDIEGRSQSWLPFFAGMESNLGVFGFTRKIRVSTASFCDMSVFLTAQEKPRPPRRTSKLYTLRIPHIFSRQNPEYPQIAPHAGKNIYVGGIETLGSLSLYLWH